VDIELSKVDRLILHSTTGDFTAQYPVLASWFF